MEEPIYLTVFTDPMMGLSDESEPILDALARSYGKRLAIRSVMSVLVRDVSDFMTSAERALQPEKGIPLYRTMLSPSSGTRIPRRSLSFANAMMSFRENKA